MTRKGEYQLYPGWRREIAIDVIDIVKILLAAGVGKRRMSKVLHMSIHTIIKIERGTIKVDYAEETKSRNSGYIKQRKGRCKNPNCRAATIFPPGYSAYPELVDKFWYCKPCLIRRQLNATNNTRNNNGFNGKS